MSSASLLDYLTEKLHSYSSKMRRDPFQSNVTSFLMNGNNSLQQYDLLNLLSEVKESAVFNVEVSNPLSPLLRPLGILSSLHLVNGMDKPDYFSNCHGENGRFSPHLFNLVSDSYRYKNSQSDSTLFPQGGTFFSSFKESFYGEPPTMSHYTNISDMKKPCDPPVPVIEAMISVNASQSPTKAKSEAAKQNCEFSHSLKLNLELANRKTKEMNKRSKKRRRRQRKNEHLNVSNSASEDEVDSIDNIGLPVTSSVCFISETPNFGCAVSVEHTMHMSPCKSSFIVPVESDSNDDSEWETFDEIELYSNKGSFNSNNEADNVTSCNSSPLKSVSSDSECSTPVKYIKVASSMSFIVPEGSSDDDSDWDTCETGAFTESTDFEFTGLFLTNLCAPQTLSFESDCNSTSDEECEEVLKMRAALLKVNKNWNELTKEDNDQPKSVSKVTFASDENLVELFPVEICERKGEWERYATERLRFKRKIDELEKVLSPCLKPEHRSKIFKKLVEPDL